MNDNSDISMRKIELFFADTLNNILRIEENTSIGRPNDLTLKEIHVIEAIVKSMKNNQPARASDIATALRVAPGTLTSAIDLLEKKGYLTRTRDENDRRGVRIALTEAGEQARAQHQSFHRELANEILDVIGADDARIFIRSLSVIHSFYQKKESAFRKGVVKILTDSTCDINPEVASQLDVSVIPMHIMFGDTEYRQDVDLSASAFYKLLAESKTQPTTSQLTPFDLEQVYREAVSDGSELVAIHLSSALSGTYQSAVLAAREVPGVYTVDSQSATLGTALLVRTAVKLRDRGLSAAKIAEQIAELSERLVVIAYIPTLKYLVRGGRLSATAGMVGSMLNIYPLLSVRDGALKNLGKVRGKSAARREIARLAEAEGIDKEYEVIFGHATAPDDMAELKDEMGGLVENCDTSECEIGAVIGVHTGPGVVGMAFITAR